MLDQVGQRHADDPALPAGPITSPLPVPFDPASDRCALMAADWSLDGRPGCSTGTNGVFHGCCGPMRAFHGQSRGHNRQAWRALHCETGCPVRPAVARFGDGSSSAHRVLALGRAARASRPADFVDPTWDETEREDAVFYLRGGIVSRAYLGHSPCRMCESDNGNLKLTDGTYVWPEGLAHYVGRHGIKLPHDFLEHARHVIEIYEQARIDETWWLAQTSTRK